MSTGPAASPPGCEERRTIGGVTRTVCDLFGIACHEPSVEASFPTVVESARAPVTRVCFATMFPGEAPDVHGIRKYEKPVLRRRTE